MEVCEYSKKEIQQKLSNCTEAQRNKILDELKADKRNFAKDLIQKYKIQKIRKQKELLEYQKLFNLEKKLLNQGFKHIAGVDEAGRGPLAGPLVAAAVILPQDVQILGLKECKQLSQPQREALFPEIITKALSYKIEAFSNHEIDRRGLQNINIKALKDSCVNLNIRPDFVLVDGYSVEIDGITSLKVVKGDCVSASIAAASVLAKVYRDRIMLKYSKMYPEYGFDKHKGYGSKAHIEAIKKFGPTKIHRRSFKIVSDLS